MKASCFIMTEHFLKLQRDELFLDVAYFPMLLLVNYHLMFLC
jgi:hypothetical protein